MATYLLLRDNKQTGPYTFDELKEKGLKAYDLVWVEGKSAAWRYPCEVDELSAFAPQVEEQPFDRFYKKPSQTPKVRPLDNATSSNPAVAATILTGDASSSVPGKRIIYVTLPAAKSVPAVRETTPLPIAKETAPDTHEKYLPEYSTPSIPVTPVGVFEDNTSQYHEDWKSSVEITPRSSRKNRSSRLGQTLVVGLTVMALLAAGIFIGLSLNKDSLGFVKRLSLSGQKEKAAVTLTSPVDHPAQPLAVNNVPAVTPPQDQLPNKDSIMGSQSTETISKPVSATTTPKTTIAPKERSLSAAQKPLAVTASSKDSSLLALPAVHREATHRSDMTAEKADKDVIKNNLSNLVSTTASGYTVGTFGGISDLQLTVSNHSIYSLDLVVVEVQYIQANKKVFKTENLYFRGIAPGSALMQEAPKSSRGIKVLYKITLVNSKELGLSYSAL